MKKLSRYNELLKYAQEHKFTIPGLNVFNMETIQAVIRACSEKNVPLIIQIYNDHLLHTCGPDMIKTMVETEMQPTAIDIALGLDHGKTVENAKRCIDSGFTGVMIDLSLKDYESNLKQTIEVVKYAHARGVSVEAELGTITSGDRNTNEIAEGFTDPVLARQFAIDSGVDCLAVAIGTAHGIYKFKPKINFDLLQELIACVPCPIVVHGGSGTPDEDVEKMVKMGIAKLNIGTDMFVAYTRGIMEVCRSDKPEGERAMLACAVAREEVYKVVKHKLDILTKFAVV